MKRRKNFEIRFDTIKNLYYFLPMIYNVKFCSPFFNFFRFWHTFLLYFLYDGNFLRLALIFLIFFFKYRKIFRVYSWPIFLLLVWFFYIAAPTVLIWSVVSEPPASTMLILFLMILVVIIILFVIVLQIIFWKAIILLIHIICLWSIRIIKIIIVLVLLELCKQHHMFIVLLQY